MTTLFGLTAVLIMIVVALVLHQKQRDRVAKWPEVEGVIETAELGYTGHRWKVPVCWLGYWYMVDGERYSGHFGIVVGDRDDVWVISQRLKGSKVSVHINPADRNQAEVLPQDFRGYSIITRMDSSEISRG